ncbi:MAG: nitroreductase family protein [Clostridia bacterium]|nr:nitroreductase family protein [Clostridia bacterium]
MSFLELARNRYSVRKFTDEPVSSELIDKILEAARVAPTGCNLQPYRILVIQSGEAVEKLKKCTKCHFGATAAMLVCCNKDECWVRKYDGAQSGVIDASIVTTHMMLEAAELGLGTTWIMHFDPKAMREEFNIPSNLEPVALLIMGHPAPDAQPLAMHSEFRPMDTLVKYDSF